MFAEDHSSSGAYCEKLVSRAACGHGFRQVPVDLDGRFDARDLGADIALRTGVRRPGRGCAEREHQKRKCHGDVTLARSER